MGKQLTTRTSLLPEVSGARSILSTLHGEIIKTYPGGGHGGDISGRGCIGWHTEWTRDVVTMRIVGLSGYCCPRTFTKTCENQMNTSYVIHQ